jgi:carbonic anhydrase/acetyltransferase-like protein (isoleucine patch superfamily)
MSADKSGNTSRRRLSVDLAESPPNPRTPRRLVLWIWKLFVPLVLALIYGLPLLVVGLLFLVATGPWRIAIVVASPILYSIGCVLVAGLIARVGAPAVVNAMMPRDLGFLPYTMRRVYGLAWTAIFYFRPLYHLCLQIPLLKRLLFRLFGYRGELSFTTYPDTWIRDLPLLELGHDVYLSNRATMGTNMCLKNGTILVKEIRIGDRSVVGHLAMVGPGAVIGRDVELGVRSSVGVDVEIGSRCNIGPVTVIDHGCVIGEDVRIGNSCYIGVRSRIGNGARISPGTVVPRDSRIRGPEEAVDPAV